MEDWAEEYEDEREHEARHAEIARVKALEASHAELLSALKKMVAWFADPGRALYDAKPEVYLAGSKPIVAEARAAIARAPGSCQT